MNVKETILAESKSKCCICHPSAAVWLTLKKKSFPYIFHMLGGNLDVWKSVTEEIRERCSVIFPNQGMAAPFNTFHSGDRHFIFHFWLLLFYFLCFSVQCPKIIQEKILGRSTLKKNSDFNLKKKTYIGKYAYGKYNGGQLEEFFCSGNKHLTVLREHLGLLYYYYLTLFPFDCNQILNNNNKKKFWNSQNIF